MLVCWVRTPGSAPASSSSLVTRAEGEKMLEGTVRAALMSGTARAELEVVGVGIVDEKTLAGSCSTVQLKEIGDKLYQQV